MPEHVLDGIVYAESPLVAQPVSLEQPIARASAQLTAFVGRTLRGPVNHAVVVRSFADFQAVFGGLWQPSPLSYAVEHFFEQGGRQAAIVRVTNGATPATLTLRCGREALRLEARAPGTREFLRASVDYDHIADAEEQAFNLVVQRVRSPGSERIEVQESFRGLTMDAAGQRFITTVLEQSQLVRVRGQVPSARPDRTFMPGTNLPVGYVSSNPDGHDGQALSDYDIIGSAVRRSGIFALSEVADLAFVYVPPLSRTLELGVSAMLVAATFCRERRAILIVDPPAAWDSPNKALTGLKQLNFYSDNAVMFFPRIIAMDRLRGRSEVFGNGGAVAGLLSRSGEAVAAAITHLESEPLLRAGTRLAHEVEVTDRVRLAANGINVLQAVRSVDRNRPALRTLACGASASSDWAYLAARRFALFVVNAIVRGTRWSAATPTDPFVWARVVRQVRTFLEELRSNGAFANVPQEDAFLVICDERINDVPEADDEQPTALNILVQFAANHVGDYHSYMITHDAHGSSVRVIAVNRMQAGLRVAVELQQEVTIRLPPEDLLRLASL